VKSVLYLYKNQKDMGLLFNINIKSVLRKNSIDRILKSTYYVYLYLSIDSLFGI